MSKLGRGQRCTYCNRVMEGMSSKGSLAATRDHTEPDCRGGQHTVLACRFCNSLKADLSWAQWRHFMERYPEWWRKDKRDAAREAVRVIRRFVSDDEV